MTGSGRLRALVLAVALVSAACGGGGGGTATSPSSSSSASVSNFVISSQALSMTANTIVFGWSGTASSYKVQVGAASGGSELLNVETTASSYSWTAPRTANIYYARVVPVSGGQSGTASTELPVFTLDMRNVIDALFFGYGPMSDANGRAPASSVAIWADGATINLIVTEESGDVSLQAARTFATDYLAATSNHIAINISTSSTRYTGVPFPSGIPANTVVIRVDNSICNTAGVIACAYYGPLPYGPGNSFVNLNAAPTASTPGGSVAIAHEIGHSFGLHHLKMDSSARPEFRFLLNPTLVTQQLSTVEKDAIAAARAGGMRTGWTRSQALAANLVLPQ